MKKILVILDGAADLEVGVLGGKTPLEAAETPNLDFFASKGKMGYMYPIEEGVVPGSDNALVNIFGNDYRLCKRGVYEALGAGFDLKRGDLALRTNFGTIDNLKNKKVVDRRAGRTLSNQEAQLLASAINSKIKLECKFEFRPTIQHRGVLVLRGGFSDNISDIDGDLREGVFRFSKSLDDEENSEYSADVLNNFAEQAFKILNNHPVNLERIKKGLFPANMIFVRGGGVEKPKLKQYRRWMSINSMPLEIGISKLSGMKVFSFKYPEMKGIDVYENLYRGLDEGIKFGIKTINANYNSFAGCYIHFKETDVPGHDNKPYEKKKMIEKIDRDFFGFLREMTVKNKWRIVVTCDHSTPCKLKSHSAHPVPVLVYPGKDFSRRFTEVESRVGDLGKIYGNEFREKAGLDR